MHPKKYLSPEALVDEESQSFTRHMNSTDLTPVLPQKVLFEDDQEDDDANSNNSESPSPSTASTSSSNHRRVTYSIVLFVLILGLASASSFLALGVSNAIAQQTKQFERAAEELTYQISSQFHVYVQTAATIHMRCRSRNFTRTDFRELYEYLIADGQVRFEAMQFDPNVTHSEREKYEREAREFYAAHYKHVNYRGFVGFEGAVGTSPRSESDFYFPIHFMEPIPGNEAAIDLDYYSHISRRQTLLHTLNEGVPTITDRLTLVKTDNEESRCGGLKGASFGVVLMHPGVPVSTNRDVWPRDISSLVICIPTLLLSAVETSKDVGVYIYEEADEHENGEPVSYIYMGGIHAGTLEFQPDSTLETIRNARLEYETTIPITNKKWRVAVVALDGAYLPHLLFVVVGAVVVLLASICLALWAWQSSRRMQAVIKLKAQNDAEKAALILDNARQQTSAERELNDYLGHEVRNPVSAAIAAVSFVKLAIATNDTSSIRPDVEIIDNSLRFVNDLLRNMLDMHRASHRQLKVKLAPADILHDVLEPVRGMLHQRSGQVELIVECAESIFVQTDSLRLKQVVLNLGRNSAKFISEGFIRFRAEVSPRGTIQIAVEDSGSGVPEEKRDQLFSKFQESLDVLSQGTGVGLFLCKTLTELMGGRIYLDSSYHSGIPGNPGARFVIDLNVKPLAMSEIESTANSTSVVESSPDLPENLNVLFVDDDAILRKLFTRAVHLVAPTWTCNEASNGETALRLIDELGSDVFDLIFVDQYMASVEKQLLGTETVAELRSRGVTARICGLSANDKELEFLTAGADAFCVKPFPCQKDALTKELKRFLYINKRTTDNGIPEQQPVDQH